MTTTAPPTPPMAPATRARLIRFLEEAAPRYEEAHDSLALIRELEAAVARLSQDGGPPEQSVMMAAFDIARVAHYLINDSGYTKRHAAVRLAGLARRLYPKLDEGALGDAANLSALSGSAPTTGATPP